MASPGSNIDHGRLAQVEQAHFAAQAVLRDAGDAFQAIKNKLAACARQRADLENAQPTTSKEERHANYQARQDLTAQIEILKADRAVAQGARDDAQERASEASQLWHACAKYAGVQ